MREQFAPEENVSPQIGIAQLPEIGDYDREQNQRRGVADKRDASATVGHSVSRYRVALKQMVSLLSRTTPSVPA